MSSSAIQRIEALERARGKSKRVAMFPRLVSVDEWGDLAAKMQTILKDNVVTDLAPDYGDLPRMEMVASR
jgi:hypothetical protein